MRSERFFRALKRSLIRHRVLAALSSSAHTCGRHVVPPGRSRRVRSGDRRLPSGPSACGDFAGAHGGAPCREGESHMQLRSSGEGLQAETTCFPSFIISPCKHVRNGFILRGKKKKKLCCSWDGSFICEAGTSWFGGGLGILLAIEARGEEVTPCRLRWQVERTQARETRELVWLYLRGAGAV